jgi:ABC-type dipeptide/oligopeptide/nickel transport system ATPase subunit
MPVWDSYPSTYRKSEIQSILHAVDSGECVSIVGLSGAGKSNLISFLAHRVTTGPRFISVDCNNLPQADISSLFEAILHQLDVAVTLPVPLKSVIKAINQALENSPHGLCILLDRFDLFQQDFAAVKTLSNNLRALRDEFKYTLTYVISTRSPLDKTSELSELFFTNTIYLGPLSLEDAKWSVTQFQTRHKLTWTEETVDKIYKVSKGYPSMLRAVCEAHASGIPLSLDELRHSSSVQHRVEEFWSDSPSAELIAKSGLENHPLLTANSAALEPEELTALEQRLLDYLTNHKEMICTKEELITAVWPEEKLVAGMRDDSLTQLVHRLRDKIDPEKTNKIQTLPGRGYRFRH